MHLYRGHGPARQGKVSYSLRGNVVACKKHTSTRTTSHLQSGPRSRLYPRLETNQNRLTSKASIPNFVTQRPPGIRIVISSWHLFGSGVNNSRGHLVWCGLRGKQVGCAGPANGSLLPFRPSRFFLLDPLTSFFLLYLPPAGHRSGKQKEAKRGPGKCPCVDHSFFLPRPLTKGLMVIL